jgi:hypothetical protein
MISSLVPASLVIFMEICKPDSLKFFLIIWGWPWLVEVCQMNHSGTTVKGVHLLSALSILSHSQPFSVIIDQLSTSNIIDHWENAWALLRKNWTQNHPGWDSPGIWKCQCQSSTSTFNQLPALEHIFYLWSVSPWWRTKQLSTDPGAETVRQGEWPGKKSGVEDCGRVERYARFRWNLAIAPPASTEHGVSMSFFGGESIVATLYDSGTFSCATCIFVIEGWHFDCMANQSQFHQAPSRLAGRQAAPSSLGACAPETEHMESGKKSRTVGWKSRFLLGITLVFTSVQ